ncbi:hypothetical protein P872_07060 [Rhodonellum psychrophilum GCM71 = DSM 17998]|uniref:M23ase beta-sheet core domain-containing protein n=2 Tax=Rhodonellum TaxID=336827 RepID=U5BMY7_9BACT|nr:MULTISPECIES: M23 family metallopeptidase [Rhodonellum]ERM81890.1 hypothetical protein P872_07060 [Rhodonellum psychrophilum GCM71 = DSM 17998]SDY68047.1 Murein DD-endopeptidase MepM and murein hydrolase activator NlpD, contain LysM domain [Rhodonellum ikkaensis]
MKIQRKLKDWIKTKFLFVIRKEDDFSVITSFSITKIRVALILVLFFLCAFGFSLLMSRTFLRSWYDPEFVESENITKILALSEAIDSLTVEVSQRDAYLKNIQGIISGENISEEQQEISRREGLTNRGNVQEGNYQESQATKAIIEEFKSAPLDFSNPKTMASAPFTDTYFFSPIKGVVTAVFQPEKGHFGIDVVTKEDEPVKAIGDGTVILAVWTLETGFIIGIQHSNELISIYKHNSVILKRMGDLVRSGEIISIVGDTGELSSGHHLHFELWYKGKPLNPQHFITFD